MRTIALLLAGAAGCFAQVHAGVKVGLPVNDFFETVRNPQFNFTSDTKRYIVGPSFEVRLPANLGIEFNALYRRFNFTATGLLGTALFGTATRGNAWEFPIMLKYRFPGAVARPFISGGANFDSFTGLTRTAITTVGGTVPQQLELDEDFRKGVVVGAGVEIKAVFLRISPEFRFTRWGAINFRNAASLAGGNQNQAEFLVGFSF